MAGRAFLKPPRVVHHQFELSVYNRLAPRVQYELAPPVRWRLARSVLVWVVFFSSILSLTSKGRGKTERLLSSARQRSRVTACRLKDGSFLVASEWLKGQNLRRVSLHRCIFTQKGARCSGGVDIPIPGHGFGQSHPQLICEGLPKPILAPKKTIKSKRGKSKKSKSKITEDKLRITPRISVPAHTPLLYLRQGLLSRGLTNLYLYGVFIDPPPHPIYKNQSDHTKNTKDNGKSKKESARIKSHGEKNKKAGFVKRPANVKRASSTKRVGREVLRKKGGIRLKRVCRLALPFSVGSKDMIGRITRSPTGEIWLTAHESAEGSLPRLWLLKSKDGWTFADSEELFSGQDGKVIPLPDGRRFIVYRKKEKTEGRPETYARITDKSDSSWLTPIRISSNHLHMRSSSPVLHPSGKEIILFSAGQNLTVRSHTLYLVTLKIPAITRPVKATKKAAKKSGAPQKELHPKKKASKDNNLRVEAIKQMLPLSKKRRLHPEYVSGIPGKKTNSSPHKNLHKSTKAFRETFIIYAQELEKLRFELRTLIISNKKR